MFRSITANPPTLHLYCLESSTKKLVALNNNILFLMHLSVGQLDISCSTLGCFKQSVHLGETCSRFYQKSRENWTMLHEMSPLEITDLRGNYFTWRWNCCKMETEIGEGFLGLSSKSVHFHHHGFYHLDKFKVKVQMHTLALSKMDCKIRCQEAWYLEEWKII